MGGGERILDALGLGDDHVAKTDIDLNGTDAPWRSRLLA